MKKKIIIICSVVAILLIAVGIYFLVRANNLKKYSNHLLIVFEYFKSFLFILLKSYEFALFFAIFYL